MRALAALAPLALLFAVVRPAAAQTALEVHTSIDDVRACVVADDGVVLAGTAGGLAVYGADGKLARVVTAIDGLPDTRVHSLLVEGTTVWIGTERGLAKATVSEHVKIALSVSFPSAPVRAIHRHEDALYVGTWGGGVLRANAAGLVKLASDAGTYDPRSRVTSLATFDGALVGGTAGGGLVRLRDAKSGMVAWGDGRAPRTIWSIAPHAGRLWVGALEGVVSLAPSGPARLEGDTDTRALASVGDAMLVGTFGKGVVRAATHGEGPADIAGVKFVQAIDPRGKCIGTRSGAYVGGARLQTGGLPENDVTAVARDGDALWVGTYERGVSVLEAGKWRHVTQVDGRVNGLALEGHRAWIATARGLTMIEGDTVRTYGGGGVLPSSAVHAVTALAGGGVLVGTEKGAAIVKAGAVTRIDEKQGLPLRAVWAVAEGPDGVLLLGTSAGLYAGKPGATWQRVAIVTGHLKDDWVTSLVVDGAAVFVGTYNAGVTRLALEHGKLVPGEHLAGGYVNPAGLAVAGGKLYAATMDGLLERPLQGGAWRTLEHASSGKDVTAVLPAGRDLWVASRRGLVRSRVDAGGGV
jgi:ligand-binding sensor domain-containing protein